MSMNAAEIHNFEFAERATLREHWWIFLIEGALLMALGIAAMLLPNVATVAIAILIGWILLLGGLAGALSTWCIRSLACFRWSLLSMVVGISAGLVLLRWPLSGVGSLTAILVLFFLVEGYASVMLALDRSREATVRWGWMLASGAMDILLAGFMLFGLPGTASWAIGLLVGIDLTFGGATLVALALRARPPRVSPRAACETRAPVGT